MDAASRGWMKNITSFQGSPVKIITLPFAVSLIAGAFSVSLILMDQTKVLTTMNSYFEASPYTRIIKYRDCTAPTMMN